MNIIHTLEQEEIARLSAGKNIPDFRAGDTVNVLVNVIEGSRKRTQAYEGVVIEVKRRGDVRRAKLYYLRERSGKAARIRELLVRKDTVKAAE